MSPLIRSEIPGLLLNKLTADFKYPYHNTGEFTATFSNAFILKTKNFLSIFYRIYKDT